MDAAAQHAVEYFVNDAVARGQAVRGPGATFAAIATALDHDAAARALLGTLGVTRAEFEHRGAVVGLRLIARLAVTVGACGDAASGTPALMALARDFAAVLLTQPSSEAV